MSRLDVIEAKISDIINRLGNSKHGNEFNEITDIGQNNLIYVYDNVNDETFYITGSRLKELISQQDYTISAVTNGGVTNVYQSGSSEIIFSISNEPPVVSDTNTNLNKHEIALIEGQQVNESVTDFLTPIVQSGNIVQFQYVNEEGVTVTRNADFSALVTTTNVDMKDGDTYDPSTMIMTLTNQDGVLNSIDLKDFKNTLDISAGGVASLRQGGVDIVELSKVAQSGRLNDLLSEITGDAFFSGNDSSLTISFTNTNGQGNFLTISNGQVQLISTNSTIITGGGSILNLNSSGANFNKTVEYSANSHENYTDRTLIDREYNDLSNKHLSFSKITYSQVFGDIETTLNLLTGDFFLMSISSSNYFVVRKTFVFDAKNIRVKIQGDIENEIDHVDVDVVGNSSLTSTSYNIYDANVSGNLDLNNSSVYNFSYWRTAIDLPDFSFNIQNQTYQPQIHFKNTDGSVYTDFTNQYGNVGLATKHEIGGFNFVYIKFNNITTGADPETDSYLYIDNLPSTPVAAISYPGSANIRIMQDVETTPNWDSNGLTAIMSGQSVDVRFHDNINRKLFGGVKMENATIELHLTYLSGTI